jgi:hypothetical protein
MTTPEQLAKYRKEFEKTETNPYLEKTVLGVYAVTSIENRWQGYLRAKQETEQAMKLAKFGAMVAHFQFNKGGCSEACIQDTADECGLFLNRADEFAPNIEATIKELQND